MAIGEIKWYCRKLLVTKNSAVIAIGTVSILVLMLLLYGSQLMFFLILRYLYGVTSMDVHEGIITQTKSLSTLQKSSS